MTKTIPTASHWGVYYVSTDDSGRIVSSSPLPRDPHPSRLLEGLPEIVDSGLRIGRPYARESFLRDREKSRTSRGCDRFVAMEWDDALALIEQELRRVKSEFGNESIYAGAYGWASAGRLHHSPSVLKRFLGLHGGYVDRLGNHSFGAALHIMPYIIGRGDIPHLAMPWPLIEEHTRLIVMFGGGHLKNSQINSGGVVTHDTVDWFKRALQAGIEIVNISPARDDVWEEVRSEWLAVRPNTDVALMLGLAHTLVTESLHDQAFLNRYCEGFSRFENYLLGRSDGRPKNSAWASEITGVPAYSIVNLARRMAKTRTLINMSWSVQRSDRGEQPVWMTVTLASILGQIGLPGGGFSLGLGATAGTGLPLPPNVPRPTLPLGPNRITNHVPAGRVTDMLLNPGREIQYNGRVLRFPDIRLIYCIGGNPFHHNTNLNRFLKAWQRPEVVIVHEPFWNPPAKFADIVLPATTTLERNDIQAADMSRFYVAMRKALNPVGQSRNDFDIFSELADRLGFGAAYSEGRDEMAWLRHMYDCAKTSAANFGYSLPCFDDFWQMGFFEFPALAVYKAPLKEFRDNPLSQPLKTPSGKIEIFSNTIASFGYEDCPPHPTWLEPSEWLGSAKAVRFPIHLLSNQPASRLHSQLDPATLSKRCKIHGREPLRMNASDASARGLTNGDLVRVFNDRGAFICALTIVDGLKEGVAQISTGAWYDPAQPGSPSLEKHGNPNVVTHDEGSSQLGQSSAAQSVLVEIEPYASPPAVTAFVNPVADDRC
jgi:biotin/methionine sulfoxide reductase